MRITPSSTGKEIELLTLNIHKLVNELPIIIRTRNFKGIRLEDDIVLEYDYLSREKNILKEENL